MLFRLLCWLGRNKILPPFIWAIGGDNTGWASFFINLPFCENAVIGGDMWCDLAILDYRSNTVYLYKGLPQMYGDECEDFLTHHGHDPSNCDYMVSFDIVKRRVKKSWIPIAENYKHKDIRFVI